MLDGKKIGVVQVSRACVFAAYFVDIVCLGLMRFADEHVLT
ncbi:hypothetical protein SDC9_204879 [bioreactor metagenome]|uniref:Uncharacterized protein n=1 Tax=bioreactor metagenome TaxID=1076179 RepID=A0A645J0G5_9ZZZZ